MTTEPTAMPAATDATVRQEIRIDARPERVFPYLIEADLMRRWMGTDVTLEPRPGGIFRSDTNGSHVIVGEFVEVEAPRRVVFTFGWEDPAELVRPGESTVEITLESDGDATILRLEHRDLPNDEERAGHAEGWAYFLGRLVEAATQVAPAS